MIEIKLSKKYISKQERTLLLWLARKRYQIFLAIALCLLAFLLPSLPYINLFVNKSLIIFLVIISLITVFNVRYMITLALIVCLLTVAFILIVLGDPETAEVIGNYTYGFLMVSVLSYVITTKI